MLKECKFHHIGIAVFNIEKTAIEYIDAGYTISEIIIEPVQKVKVAYAYKEGFPTIELLAPLNEKSPVCAVLKSRGVSPYHVCYAVSNIALAIQELKERKFMALARPVPGHGLNDALTVFMYKKDTGLIQLVEIN